MTQTKVLTLFSYDELSKKAQEKVLENLRFTNVDFEQWSEFILEDWKDEKLPLAGFCNAEIAYSGFSSQGDGASFTANVNILTWLKVNKRLKEYKELVKFLKGNDCNIEINIVRNSRQYCHENTMSIEVDGHLYNDVPDKVTKQADALESEILYNAKELSRKIYNNLRTDYYDQISDEAVIGTIKVNEWTFRENGVMENL